MPEARLGVVLWLLAGIAFLGAGLFTERSQPLWLAVATISVAVSIVTARTFASADAVTSSGPRWLPLRQPDGFQFMVKLEF